MASGVRTGPALTLSGFCVATGLAVGADAVLRADASQRQLVLATFAAGMLVLVAALGLRRAEALAWAVLLLAAAYAETLIGTSRPTDVWAPAVGVALFLSAELGYWSLEERVRHRADRAVNRRRAVAVGLAAAAGLALGLVALGSGVLASGPLIALPAVICVAAIGGLVASVAWR